jgi:hypothetical protein
MRFLVSLHNVKSDATLAKLAHAMLEAVTENNVEILRENPQLPALYQSGVRFREEPWAVGVARLPGGGLEQFTHLLDILERGWGDCAQLCSWRVAELRVGGWRTPDVPAGEDASLRYYVKSACPACHPRPCEVPGHPERRRCFHVEVRRQRGNLIEDPSRLLSF